MTFNGVYTALVTPFTKNRNIDEEALRQLVDIQIEAGIAGLVPMGTTGESPTLDHDEHMRVVEVVVEQADGRVPVIAGTGSNSTAEAVERTGLASEIGVNATLQVAPYYNKPTSEGFFRHFAAISEAADIPIIVYNIGSRTGKNIDNETMLRIATLPTVQGVKEASGDMQQVTDLIARKPASLDVLSGDDNLGLPIMALGGRGIVSVASNVIPAEMVQLANEALNGNLAKARDIHYRFLPLFQALFFETNPIPIKVVLAELGRIEEVYRLPMCPMSQHHRAALVEVIRGLNLL